MCIGTPSICTMANTDCLFCKSALFPNMHAQRHELEQIHASAHTQPNARLPLIYVNFSVGHPSGYMNISMLSAGLVGEGGGRG
jgi:hypothetical protein